MSKPIAEIKAWRVVLQRSRVYSDCFASAASEDGDHDANLITLARSEVNLESAIFAWLDTRAEAMRPARLRRGARPCNFGALHALGMCACYVAMGSELIADAAEAQERFGDDELERHAAELKTKKGR